VEGEVTRGGGIDSHIHFVNRVSTPINGRSPLLFETVWLPLGHPIDHRVSVPRGFEGTRHPIAHDFKEGFANLSGEIFIGINGFSKRLIGFCGDRGMNMKLYGQILFPRDPLSVWVLKELTAVFRIQ